MSDNQRGNQREDHPGRQERGRPTTPPGQSENPPGRRTPEGEEVETPEPEVETPEQEDGEGE